MVVENFFFTQKIRQIAVAFRCHSTGRIPRYFLAIFTSVQKDFFSPKLWLILCFLCFSACRFRGERTGEKIIRLSEATPVGTEAFRVLAFPRRNFNIQALDGVRKS